MGLRHNSQEMRSRTEDTLWTKRNRKEEIRQGQE